MAHLFCFGDSLTDCGRFFDNPPLGCGYVNLLKEKFSELHKDITVRNYGVDGFTLSRVLELVRNDSFSPPAATDDFITILIGINDIGLMMNTNRTEVQKQEMLYKFMHNYDILLKILHTKTPRIILMEPFVFPHPQEYALWLPYVKAMSQGISDLAKIYNIHYLLLHEDLNKAASIQGFSALTTDGIHLTAKGHEYLADKLFPLFSF